MTACWEGMGPRQTQDVWHTAAARVPSPCKRHPGMLRRSSVWKSACVVCELPPGQTGGCGPSSALQAAAPSCGQPNPDCMGVGQSVMCPARCPVPHRLMPPFQPHSNSQPISNRPLAAAAADGGSLLRVPGARLFRVGAAGALAAAGGVAGGAAEVAVPQRDRPPARVADPLGVGGRGVPRLLGRRGRWAADSVSSMVQRAGAAGCWSPWQARSAISVCSAAMRCCCWSSKQS